MSGDWIKMRGNLWDDPRISRICDLCDCTEATAVGGLYWLWATADQHTEDGCMPGLTLRQIDRKTGIQGFGQALCDIGWLHDDLNGVVLTHFHEHNGESAKKRCQTAKRVAKFKAGNAGVTQIALPNKHEGVTGALPREEKRREEEHTSTSDEVDRPLPGEGDRPLLALASTEVKGKTVPDCPHGQILSLWAEVLPQHLPSMWRGTRADHLRARWREVATEKRWATERDGLAWFRKLFGYVGESQFLTGRSNTPYGKRPFVIELEWLVNPTNWAKVVEGKYHQEAA